MGRRIWKYGPLTESDGITVAYGPTHAVRMQRGAWLLYVGPDASGELHVWACVEQDTRQVKRRLRVFATGDPLPVGTPGSYVGSAMLPGGTVWHVWDEGEVDG